MTLKNKKENNFSGEKKITESAELKDKKKKIKWTVVILAGGKGTRMKTPLPKVLHPVAGRPMIVRIIEACQKAGADEIRLVTGFGTQLVQQVVEPYGVGMFHQAQQLGTGHAVISANPDSLEGNVLIICGDHPVVESSDLLSFMTEFEMEKADIGVVSARLKTPGEFGRIIRHMGTIKAIVEARDASAETLKIDEVNTGIYCATSEYLQEYLPQIQNQNTKGEFYLTDLISLGVEDQCKVVTINGNPRVAFGVNTQKELSRATKYVFKNKCEALLESGVVILDPKTTYVEDLVEVGPGSVLYPNVFLRGTSKIGSFTAIESNSYVVDAQIGDSVVIKANSYIESSQIHNRCTIGPFARIRPECEIKEEAHIGNFVELKKVKFGAKAKAGHLSYLGDAEIGDETNIGCGTITCNYAVDRRKYKTKIGRKVFVGSDSQFVAPVEIGDESVIASGSTITENVPARALAIARGRQVNKENYVTEEEVVPEDEKRAKN